MILPVSDASTSERDRDLAEQHRQRRERFAREQRFLMELAEAEAAIRAPRCPDCGEMLIDGKPNVCERCEREDRYGDEDFSGESY